MKRRGTETYSLHDLYVLSEREKMSLNDIRAEYYESKFSEPIKTTISKCVKGDCVALASLVEWDKSFLAKEYVYKPIIKAEQTLLERPRHRESRQLLRLVSAAIKKVGRLPKLKRHWVLLLAMRNLAEGLQLTDADELADRFREDRNTLRKDGIDLLFDKRARVVRFIRSHAHFIFGNVPLKGAK